MQKNCGGGRKKKIKNLKDTRYIKIQNRLDTEIGRQLTMGRIARLNVPEISHKSKIWRSTFYNHFLHLDDALYHYSHKMKPDLKRLAKEAQTIDCSLEIVFSKILFFVYNNSGYYKTIIRCRNSDAVLEIVEIFRPIITKNWSNYGMELAEKSFTIFSWEMSGLIYYWGSREKFDKAKIIAHSKCLAKLATNTTHRFY